MAQEQFETVLEKLEGVVEKLENGELSLEQSLSAFKDGVALVKKGMTRLNDMERKVEVLMNELGSDTLHPFDSDDEDFE